jgi:hypothetical protein
MAKPEREVHNCKATPVFEGEVGVGCTARSSQGRRPWQESHFTTEGAHRDAQRAPWHSASPLCWHWWR